MSGKLTWSSDDIDIAYTAVDLVIIGHIGIFKIMLQVAICSGHSMTCTIETYLHISSFTFTGS